MAKTMKIRKIKSIPKKLMKPQIFFFFTLNDDAMEKALGFMGGNKSNTYSNFKFEQANGKSCKT